MSVGAVQILPPAEGKAHIRAVLRGGYWWHTFASNGRTYVLGKIGRSGDCLRF